MPIKQQNAEALKSPIFTSTASTTQLEWDPVYELVHELERRKMSSPVALVDDDFMPVTEIAPADSIALAKFIMFAVPEARRLGHEDELYRRAGHGIDWPFCVKTATWFLGQGIAEASVEVTLVLNDGNSAEASEQ